MKKNSEQNIVFTLLGIGIGFLLFKPKPSSVPKPQAVITPLPITFPKQKHSALLAPTIKCRPKTIYINQQNR